MKTRVHVVLGQEAGGGEVPRVWAEKVFFNYEEAWEFAQHKNDLHQSGYYYVEPEVVLE